jgi:hypothetical protein
VPARLVGVPLVGLVRSEVYFGVELEPVVALPFSLAQMNSWPVAVTMTPVPGPLGVPGQLSRMAGSPVAPSPAM